MVPISRWTSLLTLVLIAGIVALIAGDNPASAQAPDSGEGCTSFSELQSDFGGGRVFTFPIAYGGFADVEIAPLEESTTRIDVEVYEQSALRDRRITAIVPRRVELLTEILDVENLFELGLPLFVRIEADQPVRMMLVRRD